MSRVGDMGSGILSLQAQVPHTSLCCVGWDVLGDRCPIQVASLAACVGGESPLIVPTLPIHAASF